MLEVTAIMLPREVSRSAAADLLAREPVQLYCHGDRSEITTLNLDTHPVVSLTPELESTLIIYFEKSKQNIIEVRSDEKWLHLLSGVGVE